MCAPGARPPTRRECSICPPSAPILETRAVNADPDGRPVEYGIGRFASNRVELLFET